MALPMPSTEAIAKRYGFESYAALLAASFKLPKGPGELMQSYVGKHYNGHWFVWQSAPPKPGDADARPMA